MKTLQLPALCVRQGPHSIYSFAVDGKALQSFTTVSRVYRDDEWAVKGFQRPEVLQHVREIQEYLESGKAMLPNSLVVAFDSRVTFKAVQKVGVATFGILTVPVAEDAKDRCGFIVDGQQRSAAIRESNLTGFPVFVSGFITANEEERREQFIIINSAKPLPKGLIFELLPGTDAVLPQRLSKHKTSVLLLERLNVDTDSPLRMLIRTPTQCHGIIKDNSLLKAITNSLRDGVLFDFRRDMDGAAKVLKTYWKAVSEVFPEDWAVPASKSRLMHGAGIVGLGILMDTISQNRFRRNPEPPTREEFLAALRLMKPYCHWSSGTWEFGREWREIQNTPNDVTKFTNWLCKTYMRLLEEEDSKAG